LSGLVSGGADGSGGAVVEPGSLGVDGTWSVGVAATSGAAAVVGEVVTRRPFPGEPAVRWVVVASGTAVVPVGEGSAGGALDVPVRGTANGAVLGPPAATAWLSAPGPAKAEPSDQAAAKAIISAAT
jgi:hypothetical protein